jgi:hypothetical protein
MLPQSPAWNPLPSVPGESTIPTTAYTASGAASASIWSGSSGRSPPIRRQWRLVLLDALQQCGDRLNLGGHGGGVAWYKAGAVDLGSMPAQDGGQHQYQDHFVREQAQSSPTGGDAGLLVQEVGLMLLRGRLHGRRGQPHGGVHVVLVRDVRHRPKVVRTSARRTNPLVGARNLPPRDRPCCWAPWRVPPRFNLAVGPVNA